MTARNKATCCFISESDQLRAANEAEIIAICAKHKLPIAATFEYATDDFCTTTMQHHALAVTEATAQDGHKTITVSRIA